MSWMEAVTKCTTFSRASSRSTTATAHLKVRMEVWWLLGGESKRRDRRRDDVLGSPNALLSAIHMVMSLGLNDASVLALMIDD